MAVGLFRRVDKTHFIANTQPSDDRITLGSLWSDADAGQLYICTALSPVTFTLISSGSGAPAGAAYAVIALDATLTAERVLTAGSGISFTDGGANGTFTIAATGSAAPSFWPSLLLGGM